MDAAGILGYRVVSGTGEDLGVVIDVLEGPDGRARKIVFREDDDAQPRFVHLRYIREIGAGTVRLAGPREGYHITRVGRAMADPVDDDDDDGFWAPS